MCSRLTDSNYVGCGFFTEILRFYGVFSQNRYIFHLTGTHYQPLLAIARFSNPCQHQLTHKWLLHLDQQLTGHTDGSQVEPLTQVDPQTKVVAKEVHS